ncbi:MAG TPA: trigger factor [Bdellovibrionales bacterium]|nr:trigger factor [Pseudobdellovibrionaceae bacterium]HAG90633.1 trigger factor [Bdellovibrionales bacterium]|tara:strand:+ start:1501 stop:2799 length:1299 start_codon:yes stop_codon:yes gene_type:complete
MKATLDKLDGLSRKLNVEVPTEKVNDAFGKVYKVLQKNANIKGFRKGKAPISAIKSMYQDRVHGDVAQELVQEGYSAALQEHDLNPIGYPQVNIEKLEEDHPFVFTAEFEIRPDVEVKKYEGLNIEREKLVISDEQIDQVLKNIQQNQAETAPVLEDRALQKDDIADIDFKGFIDGEPLQNGEAHGHQLQIGSGQFIPGFEEAIEGMKVSETRTINLKFPEEYHEKSLAGKPVNFEVKLNGIKKRVLPEIDDAFAKKVGDHESLQALKDAIREDIAESENKRIKEEERNSLLKALVEANPLDVPKSLVADQKQALENDFKNRLGQQGFGDKEFAEYKSKWDADFQSTAEFMVRSTFLLDKLSKDLEMSASEEDFENKMKEFSEQVGLDVNKVKEFYKEPQRKSQMMFQITEEKLIEHLISKSKVKEVEPKKS